MLSKRVRVMGATPGSHAKQKAPESRIGDVEGVEQEWHILLQLKKRMVLYRQWHQRKIGTYG